MAIGKVWITDECISCGLCETTCPDVFELNDIALVKEDADFNENEDLIKEAADECPVEAIKFEEE